MMRTIYHGGTVCFTPIHWFEFLRRTHRPATHGSVGLPDGTPRGGHLLEAVARPAVKVFCTALPVVLTKAEDTETGPGLFDLKVNS